MFAHYIIAYLLNVISHLLRCNKTPVYKKKYHIYSHAGHIFSQKTSVQHDRCTTQSHTQHSVAVFLLFQMGSTMSMNNV